MGPFFELLSSIAAVERKKGWGQAVWVLAWKDYSRKTMRRAVRGLTTINE